MLDHYFKQLNLDLKKQGIATPQLIVDEAALKQNIQHVQIRLAHAKHLKPRLVVKSLASLDLLKLLSEQINTQRFMVFHLPHIVSILENFAEADILLGKPMPAQAVRHFFDQRAEWSNAKIQWLIDSKQRLQQYLEIAQLYSLCLDVNIEIDKVQHLKAVVNNIRRVFDLDTDTKSVEQCLNSNGFTAITEGLRLPGTWSVFEAGIRAILGQQISVVAACNLVKTVANELGEKACNNKVYFPSVKSMSESDFEFIKMPGTRKQTLKNLALHFLEANYPDNADNWLALKGIGPWTIDYAKMRGLSDPDIYLGGDLGVKKAMEKTGLTIDPEKSAPFRSYLTFQLWNLL